MIRRWANKSNASKLQTIRYHCCTFLFAAICVWILLQSGQTYDALSTIQNTNGTLLSKNSGILKKENLVEFFLQK